MAAAEDSLEERSLACTAQQLGLAVPESLLRLQAQSRRVTTALSPQTGGGDKLARMVWHGWQPPAGVARQARPLVMLHGGSGSWTHWARVIEPLLLSGYTLWLADLPGFGESDAVPGGVDVDTMLAPVAYGIEQLLGQSQSAPVCDLVGFSFGGMAAGLMAAEFPQLFHRLVLVGAPGMGLTEGKAVRLKGWRHLPGLQAQMEAHRYNLAALMLHDASLIDEETLALHALNVGRDRLPRRRLSQTDILAQALGKLKMPLAAIYGEQDPLYTGRLEELRAAMQCQYAADLHWQSLEGVGHWAQHEAPAAFCAALKKALA
ncbi:alpha/beta fold hydrolase [Comamonas sp.]|uniref:alpha/beta fold hydrolase n=1 Tax=Comamonas sp. TaxID=34028 RepID=UPI003A8CACB9